MPSSHNDEPTLCDLLKRDRMVMRVGDEIASCRPPMVFGIHGEWGSGKTSFLHQLHWYLTGDCPQQSEEQRGLAKERNVIPSGLYRNQVTVVWFEAWRYQHEREPIIALLHEIRSQLPLYSKVLNEGKKLSNVAIRGALMSLEDITARLFGFKASKVQEAGEQYEREHLASALPSHTIREHLDQVLKQLLGKKPKSGPHPRLVVLIDDLDRCEPSAAYSLLEGIKIYLTLSSCVFVLGMNQRIIEKAIAKHTAKDEEPSIRHEYAREYLEKLCHNVWHLPLLDTPKEALERWLDDSPLRNDILQVIVDHNCLARNPRRLKSFAVVLQRFLSDLGLSALPMRTFAPVVNPKILVIVTCLYHDYFELYRLIERDAAFYELIRLWTNGSPIEHEVLKKFRLPTAFRRTDSSEQEATPTPEEIAQHPNPERGCIFRLQELMRVVGPIQVSDLKQYLLFRNPSAQVE